MQLFHSQTEEESHNFYPKATFNVIVLCKPDLELDT